MLQPRQTNGASDDDDDVDDDDNDEDDYPAFGQPVFLCSDVILFPFVLLLLLLLLKCIKRHISGTSQFIGVYIHAII